MRPQASWKVNAQNHHVQAKTFTQPTLPRQSWNLQASPFLEFCQSNTEVSPIQPQRPLPSLDQKASPNQLLPNSIPPSSCSLRTYAPRTVPGVTEPWPNLHVRDPKGEHSRTRVAHLWRRAAHAYQKLNSCLPKYRSVTSPCYRLHFPQVCGMALQESWESELYY